MVKSQAAVVAAVFVILAIIVVIAGEPLFVIPIALLGGLVAAWFLISRGTTERIADKHRGGIDEAVSDEREPIPATHLMEDHERPLGDTPEAHDEINPRDIPPGSPARQAAEEQVAARDRDETRGNVEGAQGGPEPSTSRAE